MSSQISHLTVIALLVVVMAMPVGGQSAGLDISVTAEETEPGDEVTVTFETTNPGESPTAGIINITNHPEWDIVAQSDDNGLWNDEGKWLFQTIEPEATVAPSVTFLVPQDASGEYSITVTVNDGENTDTVETSIEVSDSSPDTDEDGPVNNLFLTDIRFLGAGVGAVVILLLGVWLGSKR